MGARIAVLTALGALALMGTALVTASGRNRSAPHLLSRMDPDSASADDLWARALWLSIPMHENEPDWADVAVLFSAALKKAEYKAPIYVSYGTVDSGPSAIAQEFRQGLAVFEQDVRTRGAGKAMDRFARGGVDALLHAVESTSDISIACFLAAIREDDRYLPGWFHLSTRADGEVRARALQGWIERDRDNSLPHYLQAADSFRAGDHDNALDAIEKGNSLPCCRWYPAEVPQRFMLSYPQQEPFAEWGVAGRAVQPSALQFWLDRFEALFVWMDPVHQDQKQIRRQLSDNAGDFYAAGDSARGDACIKALREMAYRLVHTEPADHLPLLDGIAAYAAFGKGARNPGADPTLSNEEMDRRMEDFRTRFRELLDEERRLCEDPLPVFSGKVSLLTWRREELRRIVMEADLPHSSTYECPGQE